MTQPASAPCPSPSALSAWLDGEIDDTKAQAIRDHLEGCASCRQQAVAWVQTIREMQEPAAAVPALSNACLDEETLAAYAEGELPATEGAGAECHVRACLHCTAEVQRLIQLRLAVDGDRPAGELAVAPEIKDAAANKLSSPARLLSVGEGRVRVLIDRLRDWIESMGQVFSQPWPALGAVAVTAMLVLVIARILPPGGEADDVRFRGGDAVVRVEVIADSAPARARPGDDQAVIMTLKRGTVAKQVEESGGWVRIEVADGRRLWVRASEIAAVWKTP